MTLATVGADQRPSTRIVLLKGFDARGLVWFTNYESRKGQELAGNPAAALQFHWVELERVVRIEGQVAQGRGRGIRRLLRLAAVRLAHRRLGLAAEPRDPVAGHARRQRCPLRCPVHAAPAAPAALGRLPARAYRVGVLAGPQVAAARPAALPARTQARGSASGSRPDEARARGEPGRAHARRSRLAFPVVQVVLESRHAHEARRPGRAGGRRGTCPSPGTRPPPAAPSC